jgi:hypothetical protein
MKYECELAQEKLSWNKTFRVVFMIVFSAFNIVIFVIQFLYIVTPSPAHGGDSNTKLMLTYRWLIAIIGIILFVIDLYMTYLFIRIMMKYIELMYDNEKERKGLLIIPCFFAILMVVRGISENLFRTGSEIIYLCNGKKIDIQVSLESVSK